MGVVVRFKDTEIGKIPEEWEMHSFRNVTNLLTCGVAATPKYASEQTGKPFLSAQNVQSGRLDLKNYKFIDKKLHENLTKINKPALGDVLYTRVGAGIGEAAVVDVDLNFAIYVSLTLIKPKIEKLNSKFLCYLLNSDRYRNMARGGQLAGAGVQNLNVQVVRSFPIPVPNLKEQNEIVRVLSTFDEYIKAYEMLIVKKKNIKQATMQQLLTGKRRLPGFSGEWAKIKLGEIAEIVGGGTPSTSDHRCWGSEIIWFTPTEVGTKKYLIESDRKITTFGLKNSNAKILPPGTVLLTTRAGIGDVGVLTKEACTNQGFQSLVVKKPNNNEYVYYLISTLKNQLIKEASGSTFLEVSPSKIRQMALNLPPINEQNEIAKILSEIDLDIEKLESKLSKLKLLKQGMMQELLTGRIRLV